MGAETVRMIRNGPISSQTCNELGWFSRDMNLIDQFHLKGNRHSTRITDPFHGITIHLGPFLSLDVTYSFQFIVLSDNYDLVPSYYLRKIGRIAFENVHHLKTKWEEEDEPVQWLMLEKLTVIEWTGLFLIPSHRLLLIWIKHSPFLIKDKVTSVWPLQ